MADVTVVILATAGDRYADAVASVQASAGACAVEARCLVVTSASSVVDGEAADTRQLIVFPLSRAYAKNRALDAASSAIVAYLDGSAVVGPEWMASLVGCFAAPEVAAVAGPGYGLDGGASSSTAAERELLRALMRSPSPVQNLAVRREPGLALGGFEVALRDRTAVPFEDLDLVMRLRGRGWSVRWCAGMAVRARRLERDAPRARGRELGRLIRRSRGRLVRACAPVLLSTTPRDGLAELAGLATGLRRAPRTASPLHPIPPAISERLDGPLAPLPPSPPPKTHLMYDAGARILHLYVNPSPRLHQSMAQRETIRTRTGLEGIPRLLAAVAEPDAVWILEDRLEGAPPSPANAREWFGVVADWVARMAGPPGPPLGGSEQWRDLAHALLAALPEHREALRRALAVVDAMPSRHMHGDLQRRNVLLAGSRVGAIDWEGAWLHGLPGLDLVFLALLAESDRPQAPVVTGLLEGRDPSFGALSGFLARLGVSGEVLAPALLAMLATWALGEQRRIQRSSADGAAQPFRDLLATCAPLMG